MQAGGNRARFFAPQAAKVLDVSVISSVLDSPFRDGLGNSLPSAAIDSDFTSPRFDTGSNTTTSSSSLVSFSKPITTNDASTPHRPASKSSEDETIAQRTRIIETETVFKANRDGNGMLNVSGLIKHVDVNTGKPAHQGASIKEIVETEELGTRSPLQLSGSKLISKTNTPSYSSGSIDFIPSSPLASQRGSRYMPPSNQLASKTFKVPQNHTPRSDVVMEDVSINRQTSDSSHTKTSNSHISTRLPTNRSDDSIKSVTSAFNKKHSGVSKNPASSFPSPVSHHKNSSRGGRAYSPHISFEEDTPTNPSQAGSFGQSDLMVESRNFSVEPRDDGDFDGSTIQGLGGYHESPQEKHGKRGEKRISDPRVDHEYIGLGKKARTDTNYDEVPFNHGSNSSRTNSPELVPRGKSPRKETPRGRRDGFRGDPQLKMFCGQDVDEYVAIHMERYEAAKKHWTECSGEEWEKGADELVDKFSKLLDFVKEHMRRRVALYASLHARIDQHEKDRADVSEMLNDAKSKLIAKTGVVVDEGKL